jgi:hypothetical protein
VEKKEIEAAPVVQSNYETDIRKLLDRQKESVESLGVGNDSINKSLDNILDKKKKNNYQNEQHQISSYTNQSDVEAGHESGIDWDTNVLNSDVYENLEDESVLKEKKSSTFKNKQNDLDTSNNKPQTLFVKASPSRNSNNSYDENFAAYDNQEQDKSDVYDGGFENSIISANDHEGEKVDIEFFSKNEKSTTKIEEKIEIKIHSKIESVDNKINKDNKENINQENTIIGII